MNDKTKRDDPSIPAIKPEQDEVASFRRSGRPTAPRQSNFNGVLVFVIVLLAVMMGIGGYALWEVQQRLELSNELLSQSGRNIEDLEKRLSRTGDTTSKAFQDMQEQIATNFSEIDKLWGVSYRTNRPNIEKNTGAITSLQAQVDRDLKQMASRMTKVDQGFTKFSADMTTLENDLRADGEEIATSVSLVRGQVQDQAVVVEGNRRSIAALEREVDTAQEAIDVIDQYRARVNQQLLELRAQIQSRTTN